MKPLSASGNKMRTDSCRLSSASRLPRRASSSYKTVGSPQKVRGTPLQVPLFTSQVQERAGVSPSQQALSPAADRPLSACWQGWTAARWRFHSKRTISSWTQQHPAAIAGLLFVLSPSFFRFQCELDAEIANKPGADDSRQLPLDALTGSCGPLHDPRAMAPFRVGLLPFSGCRASRRQAQGRRE